MLSEERKVASTQSRGNNWVRESVFSVSSSIFIDEVVTTRGDIQQILFWFIKYLPVVMNGWCNKQDDQIMDTYIFSYVSSIRKIATVTHSSGSITIELGV